VKLLNRQLKEVFSVRILAIGDFHGRFPKKLKKKVEKLAYDMIISPGDFNGDHHIKLFFKHAYGTDKDLWEVIGKKKYLDMIKQNIQEGNKILAYLKRLKMPLFVVTGNHDHAGWNEVGVRITDNIEPEKSKIATKTFLLKQKIPTLDFTKAKFQSFDLVGYPRSTYPGIVRKSELKKYDGGTRWTPERTRKDYMDHKKKMSKLFTDPANTIFVSHNVPYRTKLDKISSKGHEKARNKHYGSALVKELIKTYQPRLVIAGHMHENPGKIRIGKTVIINPGAVKDGRCALIELTEKQVRVRLIKA
jgi:Icc-related predicted phosphoesterase